MAQESTPPAINDNPSSIEAQPPSLPSIPPSLVQSPYAPPLLDSPSPPSRYSGDTALPPIALKTLRMTVNSPRMRLTVINQYEPYGTSPTQIVNMHINDHVTQNEDHAVRGGQPNPNPLNGETAIIVNGHHRPRIRGDQIQVVPNNH